MNNIDTQVSKEMKKDEVHVQNEVGDVPVPLQCKFEAEPEAPEDIMIHQHPFDDEYPHAEYHEEDEEHINAYLLLDCYYCEGQQPKKDNYPILRCEGEGGEAFFKNKFETICNKCWEQIGGGEDVTIIHCPYGRSWARGINFK